MSRVETIHIEDRRKIKEVILKFPELMEKNAKEQIANEYYNILSKEDELHETRNKVWKLENEISKLRKEFNLKSNLFDIEFETRGVEVVKGHCTTIISGDSVKIV